MNPTPEFQEFMEQFIAQQSSREKQTKLERFRRLNRFAKKGQILFCGSSLMEQFPVNELLMDAGCGLVVYNRGVGGFTTTELAAALEPCVFELEPKHIFINIGTNDLNGPDYSLPGLLERYEDILTKIRQRLPEASIHMLAYYPVNEEVGMRGEWMAEVFRHRNNQRITEANQGVENLAKKVGAEFYDLNQGIKDDQGRMKEEFTIEGMHMYPDGYYQVLQNLLPVLEGLK